MNTWYKLDENNQPIPATAEEANELLGDAKKRTVAKDFPREGVEVSTIFLTMDHAYSSGGPPILFETMIFGGPLDEEQWRYCTWAEAELGHADAIKKVLEGGES